MARDELDREPGTQETDAVTVRQLTHDDLSWVVRIDRERTGRARTEYFDLQLRRAETDTGICISLAAVLDEVPAGFLTGRLYYGEFGLPEPVAILDAIGVAREFSGRLVGTALMEQLVANLRALGIEKIQTQVEWNQWELLRFFESAGFQPAARWCLEMSIDEKDPS